MPIPALTAGLAVSIAQGVIKLSLRADRILAEEAANNSLSVIPDYFRFGGRDSAGVLLDDLIKLAADTLPPDDDPQAEDPLGVHRAEIAKLAANRDTASEAALLVLVERLMPHRLAGPLQTDGQRAQRLLKTFNEWDLTDDDIRLAAFYLRPGAKIRGSSLTWRLAMLVVDVFAEFTVEHHQKFITDTATAAIVKAVLQRFSEGDLENDIMSSEQLVRRLLSSTLNGALDARTAWDGEHVWLNAVLDALDDARKRTDENGKSVIDDDYLIGLVYGHGYRTFVAELVEEGGELLAGPTATKYQHMLADVLAETAPLVRSSHGGFKDFFAEHWADLARAGLRSVSNHGPVLLDGADPIVKTALIAATQALSQTTGAALISPQTLTAATEAAIAAIASDTAIMGDETARKTWATTFYQAFADVVANKGLQATFSPAGLEHMVGNTARAVAAKPQLAIGRPGRTQAVVTSILQKIGETKDFRIEALATAAVDGALSAFVNNPALLDTRYAPVLADIAKSLAKKVQTNGISQLQGEQLVAAAIDGLNANPDLFAGLQARLAGAVIDKVIAVADNDPKGILAGAALAQVTGRILSVLAARGAGLALGPTGEPLADQVQSVLQRGLVQASQELGQRVDIPSAATAIEMLLEKWARGEVDAATFETEAFERFFGELADAARQRHELSAPA